MVGVSGKANNRRSVRKHEVAACVAAQRLDRVITGVLGRTFPLTLGIINM
jgi:hypothetical protein